MILYLIPYIYLQIESQNPQDTTKLKDIQFPHNFVNAMASVYCCWLGE